MTAEQLRGIWGVTGYDMIDNEKKLEEKHNQAPYKAPVPEVVPVDLEDAITSNEPLPSSGMAMEDSIGCDCCCCTGTCDYENPDDE